MTIAPFGPAPIGVPNFVIDSFEIPPFLLPIYQACGTEYGIPWEVLASINKIETDFGTNLNVSSAGAVGWMQFLPSTWETYGLDANGDGRKDPYNPVDAICAAAHYLKVAGGTKDLYNAIFSYNHADWYVQEVLLYARAYGKLPTDLVGSLTGLTEGAHFPVAANARYADEHLDPGGDEATRPPAQRKDYGNAADVISSSPTRRGINIFAAADSPVVAVNDGVIVKSGHSARCSASTSSSTTPTATASPTPSSARSSASSRKVVLPSGHEKRVAGRQRKHPPAALRAAGPRRGRADPERRKKKCGSKPAPGRSAQRSRRGRRQGRRRNPEGRVEGYSRDRARPDRRERRRRRPAHQLLDPPGRQGRPADRPEADPRRLEAARRDGDLPRQRQERRWPRDLGGAGVLLLSKEELEKRVLADPKLNIYACGRNDIATGQIDRRVLARARVPGLERLLD